MDDEKEKKSSAGSVYSYIEEHYKEAWLHENEQDGFFVDIGWVSANRWEQFESNYRSNYVEYAASHPSVQEIFEEKMAERQELEDLYCRLHNASGERVDLYENETIKAEVMQEAEAYLDAQISDAAAYDTFTTFAMDVMLMDSETVIKEREAAQEISTETKNQVAIDDIIQGLEAKAQKSNGTKLEYLVRGAPLCCLYGSHMRYLDMLETHGVYLDDKPLIHKIDAVVGENIFPFGICQSPSCTLTEVDSFMRGAEVDPEGNYIQAPDDQVLTGIVCKPTILAGGWRNVKDNVKIADNATPASKTPEDCVCFSAATDASYLLCKEGGIIFPLSSGQLEFSAYRPPYMEYPFHDIGSPAFKRWCQEQGVCPYYPGTQGYNDWYEKEINRLMDENKKKDAKAAYEAYLDGAYLVGLDNMPKEQRETVKSMVNQYLESGLVKDKHMEETKGKYAGLRFDYGYNTQKNTIDYTPEQDEFYDYYLNQAEEYQSKLDHLNQQLIESAKQEDTDALGQVLTQINSIRDERDKTQERFAREIALYSEILSYDKNKQAKEVMDALGKRRIE